MSSNHVQNIAIVGATGQQGSHITNALLASKHFKVSAITRADSQASIPVGVTKKTVDYNDPQSLVEALKGQDVLITTMSVMAPPDTESKLIHAAAEAKVPFILPNEWGFGSTEDNPSLSKESLVGETKQKHRDLIESLGVSSWIGIACGFWYAYSLSNGYVTYGFQFPEKKVTFFGDGKTKINTTTPEQVARAVTALLSLPVEHEPGVSGKALVDYKNRFVRVSSFLVNQRDMFDSVLRVTGDKESDWTIAYENPKERYEDGLRIFKSGDREGFAKALYSRVFYPDGSGNYEASHGLDNEDFGLPREDLDEITKEAIEASKTSLWGRATTN